MFCVIPSPLRFNCVSCRLVGSLWDQMDVAIRKGSEWWSDDLLMTSSRLDWRLPRVSARSAAHATKGTKQPGGSEAPPCPKSPRFLPVQVSTILAESHSSPTQPCSGPLIMQTLGSLTDSGAPDGAGIQGSSRLHLPLRGSSLESRPMPGSLGPGLLQLPQANPSGWGIF